MTYINDVNVFNKNKVVISKDIITNQVKLFGKERKQDLYKINPRAITYLRDDGELNYRPSKCYDPFSNELIGEWGAAIFISNLLNKYNCYEKLRKIDIGWSIVRPKNKNLNTAFEWFYPNLLKKEKSLYIKLEVKILSESSAYARNFFEVKVFSFKPSYGQSIQHKEN